MARLGANVPIENASVRKPIAEAIARIRSAGSEITSVPRLGR
jgi:biotin operon repressor